MQFDEIERILARMDDLTDPHDPMVKACLFAEIAISQIYTADIFFVVRERPSGGWYIDAALAWVQKPTIRTEEGFMDVQEVYLTSQQPLPSAGQIARNLLALVQFEEMVDVLFIKNQLDGQLARIGFDNPAQMLRSAHQSGGLTYLDYTEFLAGDDSHTYKCMKFEFVIVVDDAAGTASLTMIKAYLVTDSQNDAFVKDQTEMAFYPFNNNFPQKQTMVREVLFKASLDNIPHQNSSRPQHRSDPEACQPIRNSRLDQ